MSKKQDKATKTAFHWIYLRLSNQNRLELQKYLDCGYTTLYVWFRSPEKMKQGNRIAALQFIEKLMGIDMSDIIDQRFSKTDFGQKFLELCSEYRSKNEK